MDFIASIPKDKAQILTQEFENGTQFTINITVEEETHNFVILIPYSIKDIQSQFINQIKGSVYLIK